MGLPLNSPLTQQGQHRNNEVGKDIEEGIGVVGEVRLLQVGGPPVRLARSNPSMGQTSTGLYSRSLSQSPARVVTVLWRPMKAVVEGVAVWVEGSTPSR